GHSNAEVVKRRRQWLAAIEPYPRLEVSTEVGDDGSIAIRTLRHRPVRVGSETFTFVREVEHREVHPPDEPAAAVTERAETLRREAAMVNEEARRRGAAAPGPAGGLRGALASDQLEPPRSAAGRVDAR